MATTLIAAIGITVQHHTNNGHPVPLAERVHTQHLARGAAVGEGEVRPLQIPVSKLHGWSSSGKCLLPIGWLVGRSVVWPDNLDILCISLNAGLKTDFGI